MPPKIKPGDLLIITKAGRRACYGVDGFAIPVDTLNPIPVITSNCVRLWSANTAILTNRTALLTLSVRQLKNALGGQERFEIKVLHGERIMLLSFMVPPNMKLENLFIINRFSSAPNETS